MIPAVRSDPPQTRRALRWWVGEFGDVLVYVADHNAIADQAGARRARRR